MRTLKLLTLTTALTLSFFTPVQAASTAQQVKSCMQDNLPQNFKIEDFSVISESASGNRASISGKIYFSRPLEDGQPGPARAMMKLEQPSALRGSAYLVIDSGHYARSGMFVYLPAVSRVRRVSGEMADGRLFGTDITYYDFKQFRNAMDDMTPEYIRQVDGQRRTHVLRFTPADDINAGYSHVIASIDATTCLPLKMDFYDNGRVVKTMKVPAESFRQDKQRWYFAEFTLVNHLYDSRTTFKTHGFHSDPQLSNRLFHPASFYRSQ